MAGVATRLITWIGFAAIAALLLSGFGGSRARGSGGTLAFTAWVDENTDLNVIGADGTHLRQLTHDARDDHSAT